MKFCDNHLCKASFKNKPHLWFLAFLLSPIHAGEQYYKKKYHLNYAHAKKLFFFDMVLLGTVIMLTAGIVYWATYDPTVVDDIELSMSITTHDEHLPAERIRSGEHIDLSIIYANDSDVTLEDVMLHIHLPEFAVFDMENMPDGFDVDTSRMALPDLTPGAKGRINLSSFVYGSPNEQYPLYTTLSYEQAESDRREEKISSYIVSPRGSTIVTSLRAADKVFPGATIPVSVTVHNTDHHASQPLRVSFTQGNEYTISALERSDGSFDNGEWILPALTAGARHHATATLIISPSATSDKLSLSAMPSTILNGTPIPLTPQTKTFDVIKPSIDVRATWDDQSAVSPGDRRILSIALRNDSQLDLSDLAITIGSTPGLNLTQLAKENIGTQSQDGFIINAAHNAELSHLPTGEQRRIDVTIPVSAIKSGENVSLVIQPSISASTPEIPNARFTTTGASPEIKIASRVSLFSEARYYTAEGDQLGRGPLPPEVGKETKYWIITSVTNGSNRVNDVTLQGVLPAGVAWTGRTSVSQGADAVYNPNTRQFTWNLHHMDAYSQAGLYIEVAITPTQAQRDTTPLLLQSLSLSGTDSFTERPVSATYGNIDLSLPNDDIAQTRGVQVQ